MIAPRYRFYPEGQGCHLTLKVLLLYKHSFLCTELDTKNQSSLLKKKNTNMKRFFQPIEKDGSFKRPTISSVSSLEKDGQQTTETISQDAGENKNDKKEPIKFLTWNANSFLLRIKNNWTEFTKFIENLDPDVIAIQVLQFCLFFLLIALPLWFWVLPLLMNVDFRKKGVFFWSLWLLIRREI